MSLEDLLNGAAAKRKQAAMGGANRADTRQGRA